LGLNRETRPRLGPSVASSLRHSPSVEHVTAASSPCHAPSRRRQPFGSSSTIRALQVCVSGVSIVCATYVLLYDPSKKGGIARDPLLRPAPTMLTVLTVSSALVLTLIIRVPLRPSRENVISIPIVRRKCLRPSQATGERPRIFCPYAARRDLIAGTLRTQTQEI
jgi:hypothetical protein